MRNAIVVSVLFHATVFAVAYFGLPGLKPLPILTEAPVMIELVEVSDETRAPPPKREAEKIEPKPEKEAKPEPKPAPPAPPEPPKRAEAPPPPPAPPEPAPEPEVAAVPPPPQPKPKAKKKPEPEPKPEPKPEAKPRPSTVLASVKPKRKPKPPDPFASVLKTVSRLKDQPRPETPRKSAEKPKDDFEARIAQALVSRSASRDVVDKLTISEIDLVRQQIMRCWNVQGGYKGIENMSVEIWVAMNPDGYVRQARINNASSFASDPFKKAFAESAYRAVLNKRCQPFKLPPEKYNRWKTMTLNFDPRDML